MKKAPIENSFLSNDGKGFELGVFDAVVFEALADDAHAWVTLAGNGERWAIYMPHWRLVSPEPSVDVDEKTTGATLMRWLGRMPLLAH